jgi:uncharacterized protein (TIGR03382 family)
MIVRLISIVMVGALAVVMMRSHAQACSPPRCFQGYLTPATGITVPANLPALHWRPLSGYDFKVDTGKISLATTDHPDVALGVSITALSAFSVGGFALVPSQPLIAGTSYLLTDHNVCGDEDDGPFQLDGPTAMFQVGPAAPLPTQLGSLRAGAVAVAPLQVSANASCDANVDAARAAIDLEFAAEAAPWREVLQFETWVDGKPWTPSHSSVESHVPGTSWIGRGSDIVYRVCHASDFDRPNVYNAGLEAGSHVVEMRAHLPGTTLEVRSDSVTVELACAADVPDAVDRGGCSAGGSPGLISLGAVGLGAVLARRRRHRPERNASR